MNNKKLIIVGVLLLALILSIYFYQKTEIFKPINERHSITLCGSALPITCYTYTCKDSYLVPDNDFSETRMPGGPSRNKMCTDGSQAIETSEEI